MKSPIYWHPAAYSLFMRFLYGEHFEQRYEELAGVIPEGAEVLEVCCGDAFLYAKYLAKKNVKYRGIDVNAHFDSHNKALGVDFQLGDVFFDDIPDADYIIIQGSLYQFEPFCAEVVRKLLVKARVKLIICEPIRNLSSSSNRIIATAAAWASSIGQGAIHFRFNSESFDGFVKDHFEELIEQEKVTAGGREKLVVLNAEVFTDCMEESNRLLREKRGRLLKVQSESGFFNTRAHVVAILFWTIFLALFIQGIHRDWWFEDDPGLYNTAISAANPFVFFYDNSLFRGHNSNEVVPSLLSSFWIDNWIAPRSVTFAYFHSMFSFSLAALAFYFLLKRVFSNSLQAFIITFAWSILRSTVVVNEYLSTRCYMEGFFFMCISLICTFRIIDVPTKRFRYVAPLVLSAILSMLSKEFYPPILLFSQFAIFMWFGLLTWAVLPFGLALFYFVYRGWAVGFKLQYGGLPLLNFSEYLLFLKRLPIYLYGDSIGYVFLSVLLLVFFHVVSFNKRRIEVPLFVISLISLSLITIYPISAAILESWNQSGTWLRSAFMIRTSILIFAAYLVFSLKNRKIQAMAIVAYMTWNYKLSTSSIKQWDEMKRPYTVVGQFAVSHPGKNPIFIDLPANWYLPGLYALYPEATKRVVFPDRINLDIEQIEVLQRFETLWVYRDGKMIKDDERFKATIGNYKNIIDGSKR